MQSIDLNLLVALEALLAEGSVAGAARRLGLSSPAVSRALGRIRNALGDPILVRAGRRLVPTPRALALRTQVESLVEGARGLLRPEGEAKPETLDRTFTIRSSESFAGGFAVRLLKATREVAPKVVLRFIPEGEEDVDTLREGRADLDVGVIDFDAPEIKVQTLFRDRIVGVVRAGHPLAKGKVTPKRFVEFPHVSASRRGKNRGPIDGALEALGLTRSVSLVVPTSYAALFAAAASDLIAAVPQRLAAETAMMFGLHFFGLPVEVPGMEIAQAWHPRFDADPGHRWLRRVVQSVCGDRREPRLDSRK
jgi:DNA-binding transcriptional LysR family regulator